MEKKKPQDSYWSLIFWWKLDQTVIRNQVEKYFTLNIFSSFKGIATVLLIGTIVVSGLFSLFGLYSYDDLVIVAILHSILAFLIFKGKRWSMILMMIVWTIEKMLSVYISWQNVSNTSLLLFENIFWWAIFMKYLYGAYVIEGKINRVKENYDQPKSVHILHKNIQTLNSLNTGMNRTLSFNIAGIILVILSLSFYWFAYRPSRIKHDCSWVKVITPSIPAYPALTENQLQAQGLLKDCTFDDTVLSVSFDEAIQKRKAELWAKLKQECEQGNKRIIQDYSVARKEIPSKENWRKATDTEYKFCLRDKGL
jgi:hypothetical protein